MTRQNTDYEAVDLCAADGPAPGVPAKIWAVGEVIDNERWMAEAFYWMECDAAQAAKPGQFIVLCPIGQPLPAKAVDAERLYFPNEETWATSALYRARSAVP